MEASTAEIGQSVARNGDKQLQDLQVQLQQLHQNLRTVRHAVNNSVAVIMAMAELSQRNPAQSAKLSQLCLEKAPQISAAIGGFMELFEGAMSVSAETHHR